MPAKIDVRLAELGLTLPEPMNPAANYLPFVADGNIVYISGQLPLRDGALITGKLGDDVSIEDGVSAARACGLSLIAQMKVAANGDLDRVRVLKLVGFVNSTADFTEQPKIINGASDLMAEVFGEAGKHARSAVSAGSLPFGVAVEIEAIIRLA